jgi:hypothetical protein
MKILNNLSQKLLSQDYMLIIYMTQHQGHGLLKVNMYTFMFIDVVKSLPLAKKLYQVLDNDKFFNVHI